MRREGTSEEADLRFLTWVNVFYYKCDMILKGVEGKVKVAGLSVYYMLSVMLWCTFYMNYSMRSSQCPLDDIISIPIV